MKKVLALTFLVFVVLDSIVCQQELGPLTDCCGMSSSGTSAGTVSGSDICIPTHQFDPVRLIAYGEFRVNDDNIEEEEDVEVRLFHDDTQLNHDDYCFCKEVGSISVRSKTNTGFGELAGGYLRIRIGDMDTVVRFYGPGFHLVKEMFTVSDIARSPRPLLLISSLVVVGNGVPTPGSYKVCEVDEDRDTYIESTHFKPSTLTGICESFGRGWLHTVGLQPGDETPENEMYVVVVSSLPCENIINGLENFTTPRITITNDVAGTVTPTPTPSTSPTSVTDGDGGGVSAAVVVGAIVGGLVVLILIGIAVVVIFWKVPLFKNILISMRGRRSPAAALEHGGMEEPQPEPVPVPVQAQVLEAVHASDTNNKTISVCDVAHYESTKIAKLLARQENADLENLDEKILSLAKVKRDHCTRLYLICQEGNAWLKEHHFQAWTFVRDCEARPLPPDLLSKVVVLRVYATHNDEVAESIEGTLLTVNIHKDRWLDQPEECVKLIGSKVRLHENQIGDVPDGDLSQNGSPPSDGPLTSAPPPPEYSTTVPPPSQEVPSVPPNGGSDTPVLRVLEKIHLEVRGIRVAAEQTVEHTGKTADNTHGLAEVVEETRDLTVATSNHVLQMTVDTQAEEND